MRIARLRREHDRIRRGIFAEGGPLAEAPGQVADKDVALFLGKKSHIVATEDGFAITDKGRESLADIEAQGM